MALVLREDPESSLTEFSVVNLDELIGISQHVPIATDSFPKPVVQYESGVLNDYFRAGRMRIVSTRLRKELERYTSGEVQYFDIVMLDKGGSPFEEGRFYMAHLGLEVDCFDFEKSDYDLRENGKIRIIRKPVLREEAIRGRHLFWIAKTSQLPYWMVSEELATHLKSQDFKGICFKTLDELSML